MKNSDVIIYETPDGNIKIEALFDYDTLWLSQKRMASLFNVKHNTIIHHLQDIYATEELNENSSCRKFRQVQKEGKRTVKRETKFYNLDVIIAVGYRVNSKEATKFRQWATEILKSYMIKGYALNKEQLMNKPKYGPDYFIRLLEEIKEIRTSERRFYQQITDIFKTCSIDYRKDSEITNNFYKIIQNKFHYAITKQTAAEIIYERVNSKKENMGLTTWENAPKGRILKSDIVIAKNYLSIEELKSLQDIVNMYIDLAENRAKRQVVMKMKDWVKSLNLLLKINMYDILESKGRISHEIAKQKAADEYNKYHVIQEQKYISDFDKMINEIEENQNK